MRCHLDALGEEEVKERGAPTPLEEKVTFLFPQTPISIRLSPYTANALG
jgi:hypothetical protein